jgi:hypothetical protein
MTAHEAKEATREAEGNSAYWSCDRCSKLFSDAEGKTEIADGDWVLPKLEPTEEEKAAKEELNKAVEDSMTRVLRNLGLIKDSAMQSLDELENKLGEEKKESDDEMNEEEVTVDPEKMNDSVRRELLRAVKPVIANVKDAKQRKILSDSFAKALKMNQASTTDYATILNIAKSNAKDAMSKPTNTSDYDFGMEIAKKYNPHYKEEN